MATSTINVAVICITLVALCIIGKWTQTNGKV